MRIISTFISTIFLLLVINSSIFSQADTLGYGWTPAAVLSVNLAQASFSNWTQGGEDALAWNFIGTGGAKYKNPDWTFKNDLKLAYGRTKLGTDDYRTTDNEIYLESVISKNIAWAVDPYFSNTLRTAVASGYQYTDTSSTKVADFFDPGYLTQSLGFTYNQSEKFSTRLGVAVQEIFTNKFTFYSDDKNTLEIEKTKIETGIESSTNLAYDIMENMLFKSNLRLFTTFKELDVWDVRWDNAIVAKINDFFNVNLTWLIVYEKKQSPKTQAKETLQIGFTYILL